LILSEFAPARAPTASPAVKQTISLRVSGIVPILDFFETKLPADAAAHLEPPGITNGFGIAPIPLPLLSRKFLICQTTLAQKLSRRGKSVSEFSEEGIELTMGAIVLKIPDLPVNLASDPCAWPYQVFPGTRDRSPGRGVGFEDSKNNRPGRSSPA
jgi:hypothetical protein